MHRSCLIRRRCAESLHPGKTWVSIPVKVGVKDVALAADAFAVAAAAHAVDRLARAIAAYPLIGDSALSTVRGATAAGATVLVVAGKVHARPAAVGLAGGAALSAGACAGAGGGGTATAVFGVGGEVHARATAARHIGRAAHARLAGTVA